MCLTARAATSFSSQVRSRGLSYHIEGRVDALGWDDNTTVVAEVQGNNFYDVEINFDCSARRWIVYADCTCPYLDNYGGCCKHIWATLLTVEKQEHHRLEEFGPVPQRVVVTSMIDSDDDDDLDDIDDDDLQSGDEDYSDNSVSTPGVVPNDVWERTTSADTVTAFPFAGLSDQRSGSRNHTGRQPGWRDWVRDLRLHARETNIIFTSDVAAIEPLYVLEVESSRNTIHPILSLAHQQRMASGKLGRIKRLPLRTDDLNRIPNADDRSICMTLLGGIGLDGPYHSRTGYEARNRASWQLFPALQKELLPRIAATGRLMIRPTRDAPPKPIKLDSGEPWTLTLAIEPTDDKRRHTLQAELRRGSERRALNTIDCLLPGAPLMFVSDNILSHVISRGCARWIDTLRNTPPVSINTSDLPGLLREFSDCKDLPAIDWPAEWSVSEVTDLAPNPEVRLRTTGPKSSNWTSIEAEVTFCYDSLKVTANRSAAVHVDVINRRIIRRRIDIEQQLMRRLLDLGVHRDAYGNRLTLGARNLPTFASTLLAEGWNVYVNRQPFRRPGAVQIKVKSNIDWFEVDGTADFDGQPVALPKLLAALRDGEEFVQLGDGSHGLLPVDWLNRHRHWLQLGQADNGTVRFTRAQLSVIDAMLATLPEADFDRELASARRQLARFDGIKSCPEPPGFRGELRPYQRIGLGWLKFLDDFGWGGCLADDMGLGKTVQVLAHLARRRVQSRHGPSLVVAPRSVVFNWQRESARFAPRMQTLIYTGTQRKALRDIIPEHDLIITTYGTLRRDVKFLRDQPFNYVVLDEAQAIKNPSSQSAKATRLLQARRRLVLTGTPVENDIGDLWSLFEFLNPGMLGSINAFRGFASSVDQVNGSDAARPDLQRVFKPFILRRTKVQVAPELPPRIDQTIDCELSGKQATCYQELLTYYRASVMDRVEQSGLQRNKMHVLEALLRLRQAACHPGLIDEARADEGSAKLETLLAMLDEVLREGHKALVFSQFTRLLAIVRRALDKRHVTYEYLDGRTRRRAARVDRFQEDPACPVFLISLKAGGTGLNLTAASYVFILDPWWNPAVESQAVDRAHRIGQDRQVVAYRLIARDTIESKIQELQSRKRALADAIISQDNSLLKNLTREDLSILLS